MLVGETPWMFVMVENAHDAKWVVKTVEGDKDLALLCINDDVEKEGEEVDRILGGWLERRWPTLAGWERK